MISAGSQSMRRLVGRSELGLSLAILTVLIVTTVLDSNHSYWHQFRFNAVDILFQTSLLGIFALGAAVVIISGGIDLSSGSMIAFAGTICATFLVLLAPEEMKNDEPLGMQVISLAILGTLLVGFLVGSLHAWLITVVGLPPFIATLATLVGLRSLGRAICENVTLAVFGGKSTQVQIYDVQFRYLATSKWIPMAVFAVLAVLVWLMLSRTVVGRHLYALGGNEQAARLSGIQTDRLKWLAYCLGTLTSTVAGILLIAYQSVADPQTLGRGYELNAIAAAVVGGCSLQGGVGTVPGVVLGALFLRCVIDGVSKIIKTGADVYEGLIVGVVVVFAVAFNQLRESAARGKPFFPGVLGFVTMLNLAVLAGVLALLLGPNLTTSASPPSATALGMTAGLLVLAILVAVKFFEYRRGKA